jgi:hypothetical protein
MDVFAQALIQGLIFFGAIGLLGFPFFVWRRPPAYYWRCPRCRHRNSLESRNCARCENIVGQDDLGAHVRADWRGFDLMAIFLVTWFASVVVGWFLLAGMGRMPTGTTSPSDVRNLLTPEILWPLEFIKAALFTVLTVWMLNGRFRWSLDEVGLRFDRIGYHVALGAAVGVGVFLIGDLYDLAVARIPPLAQEHEREIALFPASLNDPLWIVIAPTLLALTPLGGEIFYRGMLYRLFRSRYAPVPAIAVSALVYALTTGSLISFLPFLVIGAANAYLFEKTGTLVPGIASSVVSSAVSLIWLVGSDLFASS